MNYRYMHSTGLKVSQLCLGTMNFGGQVSPSQAEIMVHAALDAGVNFIDTANVYQDGRSEELVGQALAGRRDRVILATKVALSRHPERINEDGLSRRSILREVEKSLKRLNTDYIDLYYLHLPDPHTPLEETVLALDSLVQSGAIRYYGVSNFASWQLSDVIWTAKLLGRPGPVMSENVYNLLCRSVEPELIPCLRSHHVGMTVFNPLAGGLLTGKHRFDAIPAGSRFDGNQMYQNRYWNEDSFRGVELLRQVAQQTGISLVDLSIRWCAQQDIVDSVIIGSSSLEQLQANLSAMDAPALSPQVLDACDQVWKQISGTRYQYNR